MEVQNSSGGRSRFGFKLYCPLGAFPYKALHNHRVTASVPLICDRLQDSRFWTFIKISLVQVKILYKISPIDPRGLLQSSRLAWFAKCDINYSFIWGQFSNPLENGEAFVTRDPMGTTKLNCHPFVDPFACSMFPAYWKGNKLTKCSVNFCLRLQFGHQLMGNVQFRPLEKAKDWRVGSSVRDDYLYWAIFTFDSGAWEDARKSIW